MDRGGYTETYAICTYTARSLVVARTATEAAVRVHLCKLVYWH